MQTKPAAQTIATIIQASADELQYNCNATIQQ